MSTQSKSSKIRLVLSPQAERYARRDAPVETRRMAARGALPLQPVELATVLFALLHDPDAEVKSRAQESLADLPEGLCQTVLAGDAHPALLAHLAHVHRDNEAYLEKVALNPATDDRTLAFLAALPHRRVVDIISHNQERMMRSDEIVEALGANPLTGRAVIERILGFLGVDENTADDGLSDPENVTEEAAEAALLALLGKDMAHVVRSLVSESGDGLDNEAIEGNLFAAIQAMTVMQKIKLARLGGKEARALLIRDRNKVVSTSVIMSPKITENEVTTIAQSRNVSDEVLRIISNNREWTKKYQVKHALATNPKTPQGTAMKFLNYLQDRDLKNVMKSRDVPSSVAAQARRILSKKGKI